MGGYRPVWEKYEQLLISVGEPFYMGDFEQAVSFRLIQNMMIMAQRCLINEAVKLAKEVGISREVFLNNIPRTGAISYHFQTGGALTFDEKFSPTRFSTALALKDFTLCLHLAHERHLRLPLFEQTREMYQQTADAGYGEEDSISTYRIL